MTEALKEPTRLLTGQRALVTGANSGIGMAVAKALAAAGASVVVNYVSNENVPRQVVNDIEAGGGTAMAFKADVSEEDQVKVMFDEMVEAFGSIDILVNKSVWETPEAEHELLQLIPYDRIGETSDIARAAVWLASDQSDYITGTTLFVDGGMMLYPGFRTGG
jgi:glucose 1-dehydrogenase